MFETISLKTDGRGVATLWLDREDKHNAMSAQMIDELAEAAAQLGADDAVRVVVLAGHGKSFCAGGDLAWMQKQMESGGGVDAEARGAEALRLARMLKALDTLPKPLIGRVQGNTMGGGVGLVSVCDIAIGTDRVKMGLTEVRLGLIPATIGPYVVKRMGEARARQVFMSGRVFDAWEALRLGLLARVVEPDQLDDAIEAEIAPYLSAAPGAVARAKALVQHLGPQVDEVIMSHTAGELVACWEGTEAPEGIAAFFEKRKPDWTR